VPKVSQCYTTLRWDPALKAREMVGEGKKAITAAAGFWKGRYLASHFEEFSGTKYGYPQRKLAYQKRKLREKGHKRYLVWSGDLERSAKMARVGAVGNSQKIRARVTFVGGTSWRRREIFATTGGEARALQEVVRRILTAFFQKRCPARPLEMAGS
jgi:hypothetical protein